jgi:hypothetical protein
LTIFWIILGGYQALVVTSVRAGASERLFIGTVKLHLSPLATQKRGALAVTTRHHYVEVIIFSSFGRPKT